MPSDSYYDALADLLASDARCESANEGELLPIDRVSTEDEVLLAARLCRENDMLLMAALRSVGILP